MGSTIFAIEEFELIDAAIILPFGHAFDGARWWGQAYGDQLKRLCFSEYAAASNISSFVFASGPSRATKASFR